MYARGGTLTHNITSLLIFHDDLHFYINFFSFSVSYCNVTFKRDGESRRDDGVNKLNNP